MQPENAPNPEDEKLPEDDIIHNIDDLKKAIPGLPFYGELEGSPEDIEEFIRRMIKEGKDEDGQK